MNFRWLLSVSAGLLLFPLALRAEEPKPAKVDPLQETLEKLLKELGGNKPTEQLLEEFLKQMGQGGGGLNAFPFPFGLDDDDDLEKELREQQEALLKQLGALRQLPGGGGIVVRPGGRIAIGGVRNLVPGGGRFGMGVEKPNEALITQLDLPIGKGLVCTDVPADSVAGKAGIKPHDILLEVAGKEVPSDFPEFIKNLQEVKADEAIDVVVLRKGRKETIKGIKLPESKVEAPLAFPQPLPLPGFPGNIRRGANSEGIRVEQVNDAFTIISEKAGVKMTITGSKETGTPVPDSIEIEADGKTIKADSLDKLPKEYQEAVTKALKNVK